MSSGFRAVERGIGWILISLGAVVLISYILWHVIDAMMGAAIVPWYLKGAILALLVGILIIVVSVVREKILTAEKDPYGEVDR